MMEQLKEAVEELSKCLNPDSQTDLKNYPVTCLFELATSIEFRKLLLDRPEVLKVLIKLVKDSSSPHNKNAAIVLVNITGDSDLGIEALLLISESESKKKQECAFNLIEVCIKSIMDKSSLVADECCMILTNMTRSLHTLDRIIALIEQCGHTWEALIFAFNIPGYHNHATLNYLGSVFNNLSQSTHIRGYLLRKRNSYIFNSLIKFINDIDETRQRSVIGILKNCTFETTCHKWLLSENIDVLPCLLLPLAGPEKFEEEENDKLPLNLQYLPKTKTREENPETRLMLLEILNQLCATKVCREILREKNTYIILREYHKWEKNTKCLLACEKVVDILIRTEEEIGIDNLKEVEVPPEYTEKFQKMDEDFINDT